MLFCTKVLTWYHMVPSTYVRTRVVPSSSWTPYPTEVPGVPPRRRLLDPGALQGTGTPRRRAQGVMQALVRIQAYMLADFVVAIPAVDLAVEAECKCVLPCIRSFSQLASVYPPKTHVVLSAHVCSFPIRKL
jgi:hypothetical protein